MAKRPSKRSSISEHPESIPPEEKAVEIFSEPLAVELESMPLHPPSNDILSSSQYAVESTLDPQPQINRTTRIFRIVIGGGRYYWYLSDHSLRNP